MNEPVEQSYVPLSQISLKPRVPKGTPPKAISKDERERRKKQKKQSSKSRNKNR